MDSPFTHPLPRSAYFRLLEYQKNGKIDSYEPDLPLILFISLSRVAAGLSLVSILFPESIAWSGAALGCMMLATLASIAHLSVPWRFITMAINSRSFLVWEIRMAGALGACLGLQFLSEFAWGWLHAYRFYLSWLNFGLSIVFLFSTGWAYRFVTHPAWRTSLLPLYYLASALPVGLGLRSIEHPSAVVPFFFAGLLIAKGVLLSLYKNHLETASPTSLKNVRVAKERWVFLAFLWADLLLPGLLTLALLVGGKGAVFHCLFTASCLAGIFLERVLFFRVEKPVFFLSFIGNPELDARYPYWIRG